MKKLILIILLLLIVGCTPKSKPEAIKDTNEGNDALIMEFFQGSPPKEVLENGRLPIAINMFNKGAYDIQSGILSTAVERDYFTIDLGSLQSIDQIDNNIHFSGSKITFQLNGKDLKYPQGGQELVRFFADAGKLSENDPQSTQRESLIAVTACYDYQTQAGATVCVDTDVYDIKSREKGCEIKDISLTSQGAPIAVKKIETEMIPDSDKVMPKFTITIKNEGKGKAINHNKIQAACDAGGLELEDWNRLEVEAYISQKDDAHKLDCDLRPDTGDQNVGVVNLKDKEVVVRCMFKPGFKEEDGVFSTPLFINIDYGYTHTISKKVLLKKDRP